MQSENNSCLSQEDHDCRVIEQCTYAHENGLKRFDITRSKRFGICDLLMLMLSMGSTLRDRPSTTYTRSSFQGDLQRLTTHTATVEAIGKVNEGNATIYVEVKNIIRDFRGRRRGPASRDTRSNE